MKINRIFASAILSISLVTGATLAVAPATSATQIVVAQSPTETAPTPAPFTATPNAQGSLVIKADPSSRVVYKAKGQKAKAVKTNKAGTVQIKKLTPGVKLTLTTKIAGATKRITAVPEGQVVAANNLRVLTTEIPGQLQLTLAAREHTSPGRCFLHRYRGANRLDDGCNYRYNNEQRVRAHRP